MIDVHSSEYLAWCNAKRRCYDRGNNGFERYGGRGIGMCPEWRGRRGFMAFIAHIGPKPSPRHTLDRWPNNNGNYEPGNVRWATSKQQGENKRNNIYIEAHGKRLHISEWMQITGLTYHNIRVRLFRGWTPDEVVDPHHKRTMRSPKQRAEIRASNRAMLQAA